MERIIKGIKNPGEAARYVSRDLWKRVLNSYYLFNNVPEYSVWDDWDLCIILDACRPDVLAECAADFDFIPEDVPKRRSNASQSNQWMERNFTPEYANYLAETTYVTGNPYTSQVDTSGFDAVDEVWTYAWSDELGTQPPGPLTDRAVDIGRNESPKRLLVHYMQPHFPSIPVNLGSKIDLDRFGEGGGTDIFPRLRRGELTHDEVWHAYRENCKYVLNSVETLLENYDAETAIITADHANAFGEKGIYRHPEDVKTEAVRTVPWVETSAVDHGMYEPKSYDSSAVDPGVEERLRRLGYRDP
ncbi:hypothetical protein EXE41_04120 [Halorubrum sp. SD690R]|uniref:hypothetical protein n=1 Tax=Halorubrum sp. SD690R TaxID=2518117 RepID=UPI0010F71917|nr:hypothetical protein [Halorubrum sp. SD690R]TKX47748.1 hypothetical protein EXE41_04120 [Halorubrum sp. SD690R]